MTIQTIFDWMSLAVPTVAPIVGGVWYLSGRLTSQDKKLDHLHECIEYVKEDVRELKDKRQPLGFKL